MNRLTSLDFFRGLTIALMIIVNTPGSWTHVFPPLRHAEWHGATPTDLVFPFFLFIVGVSIALAYANKKDAGHINSRVYIKIVRRTITILLLGILLAVFPKFDFSNVRIVGVLFRIGLVFLACSFLYLKTSWKTQLRVGIACLVGYWIAMKFIPFPGGEVGQLDPGVNMAAWIDTYITPGRMYKESWDPEGMFSTIPAIGTGIFGLLIGQLILNKKLTQHRKIIWIFSIGFIAFLIGNAWGWIFPINKHIWTSSYVMFCGGLAAMFLAASMWFIDELNYSNWFTKLGVVFGMNAITAYVLSGLVGRLFQIPLSGGKGLQSLWMSSLMDIGVNPQIVSLGWAIFYMLLIFVIAYVMYRKKIFVKV